MARLMCFRPNKKHQDLKAYESTKNKKTPQPSSQNVAPASLMGQRLDEGLSIYYITKRLIVLVSPSEGTNKAYVESLKQVALTLKAKHFEHYKLWSLSRRRRDLERCVSVEDQSWPDGLTPPLDRLCGLCKQIDLFLKEHEDNVAVIHSKGDASRAAIIIAAFMHYNVICSNEAGVDDRFSMQCFADKYIGGTGQPGHRRYISYFSSLLSGRVRVNPTALYLHKLGLSHAGPRTLLFKIYERLLPVHQTQPQSSKEDFEWKLEEELKLRGDVLIKCFVITADGRSLLFLCPLNTCALELAPAHQTVLTFHKEDLDRVFNESSVDNRLALDVVFSLEPPKIEAKEAKTKPLAENRTNSYENFTQFEDEDTVAEYSEIRKRPSEKTEEKIENREETAEILEENIGQPRIPPPVPPKPRSASAMGDPLADMPERRGVLPAAVRPVSHRPPTPEKSQSGDRATPSIEPDLVGKDRYDKASKCFSYAPKKELAQAFERPRRQSITKIERREEEVSNVTQDDMNKTQKNFNQGDLQPVTDQPHWDEEIEQTKQKALLEELARIPARSQSAAAHPYTNMKDRELVEEKPLVIDQARRAVTTTSPMGTLKKGARKTNYGSYRTLNDEAYNSDMDDLCDPDFYLNFEPEKNQQQPRAHMGAKSVELPRRRFQPVEAFTDPLDEVLSNYSGPSAAKSTMDLSTDKDSFRNRHCHSVAALSNRDRKLFKEDYDAVEQANDPDDWLTHKLRKVRSKRDLDPDLVRRRTQEKMLLEELKNAHDDGEGVRKKKESEYTTESVGYRQPDPLAEYKREEERLRNTHSPYQDLLPRRSRPGMRGKPPTPPPRERSRSPARSERATPSMEQHYATYRSQNGNGHANEEFDFSTLNSTAMSNGYSPSHHSSSRTLNRHPSLNSQQTPPFVDPSRTDANTKFVSGQERVAAAIYRAETPSREMYGSTTTTLHRPETPTRYFPENSSFSQRSETPAFPLNVRETPIPFHPLLYNNQNGNGHSRQDLDRAQTLNYRSPSPRSHLSRRSSFNSVDTSEILHHHPVFVKDTSKYWYKPNITREQAINMLRDKPPGTFVVRDSNSFHGAFGLALKVSQPPPGVPMGDGTELVRHFLIEPSPKGVKLKGCNNEPVFGSLSALVYQHSITPLALPEKLLLSDYDPASTPEHVSATQALLEQGAACNVAYLGSIDCESLTGSECVRRSIGKCSNDVIHGMVQPVSVHFKVSSQGVTLTDNTRKVFFRRHFPVNAVIFAGLDPSERRFDTYCVLGYHDNCVPNARMFAFVARKASSMENSCHVFAELEAEQPASAVVNFINKVMLAHRRA